MCTAPILVATFLAFAALAPTRALAQSAEASLQAEVERIAAEVGGSVGVGVRHLETGREFYANRSVRYPMASVFKLPVARSNTPAAALGEPSARAMRSMASGACAAL